MASLVRSCSQGYVFFVCFLVGVLGLGLTSAASWAYLNFGDYSVLVSRTGLIVSIVTGVVAFLVSLLGCVGASSGNRCALCIFCAVVLAMLILQIVGAVLFSAYMGELDNITGLNTTASTLKKEAEIEINDFIYSSYFSCCYNDADVCSATKVPSCLPVYNCDQIPSIPHPAQTAACYRHNPDHPGKAPLYVPLPPDNVERGICTLLADADLTCTSSAVVRGGSVDPKLYQRAIYNVLKDNLNFIAYGAAGVAAVELFAIVSTLCLLFARGGRARRYRRERDYDSYIIYRDIQ